MCTPCDLRCVCVSVWCACAFSSYTCGKRRCVYTISLHVKRGTPFRHIAFRLFRFFSLFILLFHTLVECATRRARCAPVAQSTKSRRKREKRRIRKHHPYIVQCLNIFFPCTTIAVDATTITLSAAFEGKISVQTQPPPSPVLCAGRIKSNKNLPFAWNIYHTTGTPHTQPIRISLFHFFLNNFHDSVSVAFVRCVR